MTAGLVTNGRRRGVLEWVWKRHDRLAGDGALCQCSGIAYRLMVWATRHGEHPER